MRFCDYGYDWLVWALLACVPLIIFWQDATSLAEQGVSGGGPLENAAIFPAVVAWLLVGLLALNGWRIVAGRIAQASAFQASATTHLALLSTALFVAYLLSLHTLGYYVATPLLLLALLRLYGVGCIGGVVGALVMTVIVAGVFEGLLNVVLPLGLTKLTLFG